MTYLNPYIFQLEPLIEPWELSGYGIKPPGRRVASGKLYSRRLLLINMTTALHRTLRDLREQLAKEVAKEHGGPSGPPDDREIVDLASGQAGTYIDMDKCRFAARVVTFTPSPAIIGGRSRGSVSRGVHKTARLQLVERGSSNEPRPERPRWSPPLNISLTESRISTHRVWPCAASLRAHAVVIAEVGTRATASTEVKLRSNLTIRNTLQCAAVRLIFERLHTPPRNEPISEHVTVQPGDAYHVPLHLTSNTRLAVRPVGVRGELPPSLLRRATSVGAASTVSAASIHTATSHSEHIPSPTDAQIPNISHVMGSAPADPAMASACHVSGRALVCLQWHSTSRRRLHFRYPCCH